VSSTAAALRQLNALFPSFQKTGWKPKGGYAPLPRHLRQQLADAFAPLNKQLYEYLDRDFAWEAANAAALQAEGGIG
jgi:hypothetical protein